jgi:hypothetical protein
LVAGTWNDSAWAWAVVLGRVVLRTPWVSGVACALGSVTTDCRKNFARHIACRETLSSIVKI